MELDRAAKIDDIADFFVEYINSDKMGLVSIQHLIICMMTILTGDVVDDLLCVQRTSPERDCTMKSVLSSQNSTLKR
jgi:hypothetical protein